MMYMLNYKNTYGERETLAHRLAGILGAVFACIRK